MSVAAVEGASHNSSTGGLECTFRVEEIPTSAEALDELGPAPTTDSIPYRIFCGSALWGATWVTPADIVDSDAIARAEADRYVQTVLAPALAIRHSPAGYAVTGAPSHHWIDGWSGQPITIGPINPFGRALTITLTLRDVTWDFGDNTPVRAGDLGSPVPSTVQHAYTHRSTTTDPDGTYTTVATITIDASYSVDGGSPITVTPPLTVAPTSTVVVRELQAVLD